MARRTMTTVNLQQQCGTGSSGFSSEEFASSLAVATGTLRSGVSWLPSWPGELILPNFRGTREGSLAGFLCCQDFSIHICALECAYFLFSEIMVFLSSVVILCS